MFGSSFISAALWHRVQIPYLFYYSLASCPDPLSFQRLSNIVSRSPFFLATLQHRVRVPYLFCCSLASCPDPHFFGDSPISCLHTFSFWWLSGIIFGSSIFLAELWHSVLIPYLFGNSPALCLNLLSFRQLYDIVSGSPIFSAAF